MSNAYPHLFAPIRIGPVELSNRIVMSPMTTGYAAPDGTVTERQIAYYAARARGGVGAVFVENAYVHSDGVGALCQLGACEERFLPGLRRLAQGIHGGGARAFLQLAHAGSKSRVPAGELPLTPSGSGTTRSGRVATEAEILAVVDGFCESARIAAQAGFDGVELHGAHGYLGHEFFSPAFNRRTDRWGGDAAGRARVLTEAIRRIRAAMPGLAITVRLSVDEFTPGGLDLEETKRLAPHLIAAGVDALHASSGGGPLTRLRRPYSTGCGEATMVYLARGLREVAAGRPVIAVGRFLTPERCEEAVCNGETDLIALGRALLADPDWVFKSGTGLRAELRPCTGCQACQFRSDHPGSICTVNPYLGREEAGETPAQQPQPGALTVLGSGFYGLAAAREAALCGYRVSVWTGHLPLGGLWALRARVPGNVEFSQAIAWYRQELERLHVPVSPGEPPAGADPGTLVDNRPGAAIRLELPGGGNLITAEEALLGEGLPDRGIVAVVGNGQVAGEAALAIASHQRRVIVVCSDEQPFRDGHPEIGERLRERLATRAITVINRATPTRFEGGWLEVTTATGAPMGLGPLTAVVGAQGWEAGQDEYEASRLALRVATIPGALHGLAEEADSAWK